MSSAINKLLSRSAMEFGNPNRNTAPPKQWLPGIIRWPIRIFIYPFILLDQLMQKVAKIIISPPYKQVGGCSRRGNCCHRVLITKPKSKLVHRFINFYYTQIYGFYTIKPYTVEDEGSEFYVMGCRYLSSRGSCTKHKLRPVICRQWPRIEYFDQPRLIKGCGYRPVLRKTGLVMLPEDTN